MRYLKQLFRWNLRLVQGLGLVCLCAWWLMLATPAQAAGALCTVGSSGATYTTIQAAVNNSACTMIQVTPGTYIESVEISRNVAIYGTTSGSTIVEGNFSSVYFYSAPPTPDYPGRPVLRITTGVVTLTNLILQNGAGFKSDDTLRGGGIYNAGTLTVNNTTIRNNFVQNSTITNMGGGIYNAGTLTVNYSTISGNTSNKGGGIFNAGTLTVNNSTISGKNSSGTVASGDGIGNIGTLTVNNSTISDNIGSNGGGITGQSGTMTLNNSIINQSCLGSATLDSRNNLLSDAGNACGLSNGNNGNIVGQDPKLGPLALNAPGTTATYALLSGSVAIDAGNDAVCSSPAVSNKDQRSVARAQGAHCDIGAYEAITTGQIDTIAPETNITGQTIDNASASFTFNGSDSTSGIANYQCSLDGAALTTCNSPQRYSNLSINSHTFQVRAVDTAGNVDASPASSTWTVGIAACYVIRNGADWRLLTATNNTVGAALKVAIAQSGNALQLWKWRADGAIVNLQTSYVVDVYGASTAPGTAAIVYTERMPVQNNQRWTLNQRENGYVAITTKLNGYVLDVSGKDSVSVILYPEKITDFANQRWLFVAQPTAVCAAATVPTANAATTMAALGAEDLSKPVGDEASSAVALNQQLFLPLINR